jgi:hypothetical protein
LEFAAQAIKDGFNVRILVYKHTTSVKKMRAMLLGYPEPICNLGKDAEFAANQVNRIFFREARDCYSFHERTTHREPNWYDILIFRQGINDFYGNYFMHGLFHKPVLPALQGHQ